LIHKSLVGHGGALQCVTIQLHRTNGCRRLLPACKCKASFLISKFGVLVPDSAVHIVDIAQHDAQDLLRNGPRFVVRCYLEGPMAAMVLGCNNIDSLKHSLAPESAHDQRAFVHSFWTLMSIAQRNSRQVEEGCLLGDRA